MTFLIVCNEYNRYQWRIVLTFFELSFDFADTIVRNLIKRFLTIVSAKSKDNSKNVNGN